MNQTALYILVKQFGNYIGTVSTVHKFYQTVKVLDFCGMLLDNYYWVPQLFKIFN